jgi:hypothetical protein
VQKSYTSLAGERLVRIRRAFYEFQGVVERDKGPVELSFDSGTVMYFDVGADAESLAPMEGPWVDYFSPPLSAENEEYVRTHGKDVAFDVSNEYAYRRLIGRKVSKVREIFNATAPKVTGLIIEFDDAHLRVEVVADDLYVSREGDLLDL